MPLYYHKLETSITDYAPTSKSMPSGAIFYAPLSAPSATAETGQTLVTTGTVSYSSVNGIPCSYFNGSTSISFAASDFAYGQNFSVSFWVNCNISDKQRAVFSYGTDQANKAFAVMVYTNGRVKTIGSNDVNNEWTSDNNVMLSNTWTHIIVVNHITYEDIFVNGIKIGSFTYSRAITNSGYGYIGSLLTNSDTTWNMIGYISSVRYYDRALTQAEITTLSQEFVPVINSSGFDTFGLPEESYSAAEAGCGRLPYTLLDYIESTGTQYIDSGIVPTTNIGMSCDFTVLTGGGGCFCGAGSDNWRWGGLQTGDTTIQVSGIMATGVTWQDYQVLTPGQRGNFKFNINADRKAFYNDTEIRNSIPTGSTTTTGTIFVFAYNYNGTGEPWRIIYNGRIHSLTLFDGTTVVRDFIPVLTLQGVPCMYDKVSKQFFYNQGTGTFLYGELS